MQNTSAMSTESKICQTSAGNVLLQAAGVRRWVDVYSTYDSTKIYLFKMGCYVISHSSRQQGEGIRVESLTTACCPKQQQQEHVRCADVRCEDARCADVRCEDVQM